MENKKNIEGKDKLFAELKKYEKDKLTLEFTQNISNCFNILKNNQINLILEPKLISNIIKNENGENILKDKISNFINDMERSEDKNLNIDHINILLVGRSRIGKKLLSKLVLNNCDLKKRDPKEDFVEYKNEEEKEIQLIKYRGIGYDDNNDPEIIKDKTVGFIKARSNTNNPNDFIHCIWYCIVKGRIEEVEIKYLKMLKKVYENDCIPIIIVYLQGNIPEKIKKEIEEEVPNLEFFNVIVKEIKKPNGKIVKPNKNDLITKTIDKIKDALNGEMQKIMIQSYINNIKKKINDENKQIKQKIINLNIKNFINEYNTVLNGNKFINYLINILGRNLKLFFNVQKNITNRSLNLILYSNIIKNIKNYINTCNNDIRNLIEDISNGNSEDFIEKQVNLEKLNKTSIKLQNKRTLNGFKKTEKIFLKKIFIIYVKNI